MPSSGVQLALFATLRDLRYISVHPFPSVFLFDICKHALCVAMSGLIGFVKFHHMVHSLCSLVPTTYTGSALSFFDSFQSSLSSKNNFRLFLSLCRMSFLLLRYPLSCNIFPIRKVSPSYSSSRNLKIAFTRHTCFEPK